MLHKLFGIRTVKPPSGRKVPPKLPASIRTPAEERSQALKIIHAGGRVESYYMAIPAARILEKQPSFVLARPEVFRRPWDSLVRPEEILTPGQKYFIVPRQTVKKLRRQIPRPTEENPSVSFVLQPSSDVSSISSAESSKAKGKTKARNRRVRFFGVDSKHDSDSSSMEKKGSAKGNLKKSLNTESGGRNSKVRNAVTWQPNLAVIDESHGSDE